VNLTHNFQSKSFQTLFPFSGLILQHFFIKVILHKSRGLFAFDWLHRFVFQSLFFLQHGLQFLLANGNLLPFFSSIKPKGDRNGHVESFVMGKSVCVSNLQKLILFAIDSLLLDLFAKFLVAGSGIVIFTILLFST